MFQALHATSVTLQQFITAQITSDPFLAGPSTPFTLRGMMVSLQTPPEMIDAGREGVSLWLYRVMRDDQRLNEPPRRLTATTFAPRPLPLRLHYLVTPITTRDNLGDPDTEQFLLGKVLQSFHSHPLLRGADLRAELVGTDAELNVRLEALDLDQISRVWEALEGSYQLSVSYEVAVVDIDSARAPEVHAPVLQALAEAGPIVAS
jgi:Pvc16 N-terminal domain